PILRRQKTGELERLMPTGPAVGMFDDAWFEVKTERLQPGDLLFAFTDGVNDAHNAHGELLGEEDVLAIVQEAEAVDTLLTHITNTVFNQIGSSTQFDDMTFWAISRQA
ncbi:MAG: PP2C family protein-serine/threonine phosphatase, partial [Chloroflexota bacterium]